ncbi:MAG: hypothetical protein JW775_09845, partial [Candidatus Aminicenantes bacterium]|nr:hypothetical protein [Candidatus Aminicenantes bacterium]
RTRMPADLWEDAVALALEHGVYRISSALGLNYENLKRRALVVSGERRDTGVESGGFIELRGSQVLGSLAPERAETVLELADGNGATLKVRLPLGVHLDVQGVAEGFWSRRG